MQNIKIKSSKSEAIYSILEKELNVSNNFYEKESFIYHHSVCNHDLKEFKLKPSKKESTKATWIFVLDDPSDNIRLRNSEELSADELLEAIAVKSKVQNLLSYVINN